MCDTPPPPPSAGLVKQYRLESMQSDILDANLDREAFPITVVAEAGELGRWGGNLSSLKMNCAWNNPKKRHPHPPSPLWRRRASWAGLGWRQPCKVQYRAV